MQDQIWMTDGYAADRATVDEFRWLTDFLTDNYAMAPQRSYWPPADANRTRLGYDTVGVFAHRDHCRKYYAIPREAADVGAPLAPVAAPPEAERAEQLRQLMFQQTFKAADRNGDGLVSKAELGLLLRRVAPGLRSTEVDTIFNAIDSDRSQSLSLGEFTTWLESSASGTVATAMQRSILNHRDFVKAAFRLWDTDGDGSIGRDELVAALTNVCPEMKRPQVEMILKEMDKDHSQTVDYTEFADYLWSTEKQ